MERRGKHCYAHVQLTAMTDCMQLRTECQPCARWLVLPVAAPCKLVSNRCPFWLSSAGPCCCVLGGVIVCWLVLLWCAALLPHIVHLSRCIIPWSRGRGQEEARRGADLWIAQDNRSLSDGEGMLFMTVIYRGRSCHGARPLQTLGISGDPPGDNCNHQEASRKERKLLKSLWDLFATIKKNLGRQVLCFATQLFSVSMGCLGGCIFGWFTDV